ncbi:MAG: hypothetical protein IT204_12155 [Fimbriimonadaceae bacterium]|nr:hypothetical protein [Fimbriimonadaceae bacterium]
MSVCIEFPPPGAVLGPADGELDGQQLRIEVRGSGPRDVPLFVNEEVLQTAADGRFTCPVALPPGDGWVVVGLLSGCACVTNRVPVRVALDPSEPRPA